MKDKGIVFNIQKYSVNDGDGIRTIVFLKGCPLRCQWCSNPESQKSRPELFFTKEKCTGCGRCERVCPVGARSGGLLDTSKCILCGKCAEVCLTEAIEMSGKEMSIPEIIKEVEKDREFYENSGGGVTLSGGEALAQPEFAAALMAELKKRYYHTAIETTGYAKWDDLWAVLKNCDQILYDIKHMDSEKHKEYTGVGNELIRENLKKLAGTDKKDSIVIRIPVIGGVNDDEENIRKTAEMAAELGIKRVDLLPYHRFGEGKYQKIGKTYDFEGYTPSDEQMQHLIELVEGYGIKAMIGG